MEGHLTQVSYVLNPHTILPTGRKKGILGVFSEPRQLRIPRRQTQALWAVRVWSETVMPPVSGKENGACFGDE